VVLDPGGYGTLTITKAISIVNEGVGEASMFVAGGNTGITINAGVSDIVSLRGLTIYGIGVGGGNGIVFNTGKSLTVENCAIRNLTGGFPLGSGIKFQPNGSSSLAVANTVVANNAADGILVIPTGSGTVKAVFSRVEAYNSGSSGIAVTGEATTGGTLNATVADSVAANNSNGFFALSNAGQATTSLMVIRSVAANNGIGLRVANTPNATLRVGQSTITGNTATWSVSGTGVLQSYGDNNIDGNVDGGPILTVIAKK